ncbi:MAG: hypothetical protein IT280_13195 [Ignavibacteria bacterium]|nr:hypothetical protein [Ignavibacteria bacterium]
MRNTKNTNLPEVIDMLQEEPGSLTVEELLNSIPKSNSKKLQVLYDKIIEQLSNDLLEMKELEVKKKKAQDLINNTEPVKALKRLKKSIKIKKSSTDKLMQALMGVKSAAKAMDVELKTKKALTQGD